MSSRKLFFILAGLAALCAGFYWSVRPGPPPAPPPPAQAPAAPPPPVEPPAPPKDSQARLTSFKGSVYLRLKDNPLRVFTPAEADAPLQMGDIILTGRASSAEIAIDAQTLIQLGPNSAFTLNALERQENEFYLGLGSLVAKVQKVLGEGEVRFRTPTGVAAVRGTELAVTFNRTHGTMRAGIFSEGSLSVTSDAGETALRAGEETVVQAGKAPAQPAALAALKPLEKRMEMVRQRAEIVRSAWAQQTPQEEEASRQRLETVKTVELEKLKDMEAVLKPTGGKKKAAVGPAAEAAEDPLGPLRQKLNADVKKKMRRDKELDPVKEKLRQDVLKKMEEDRKRRERK